MDDFSVGVAVGSDAFTAAPLSGRTIWKIATPTPRNATVAEQTGDPPRPTRPWASAPATDCDPARLTLPFESIPAEMVALNLERYVNG